MGDPALVVANGLARVGTKVETRQQAARQTGVVIQLDDRHNQLVIRYDAGPVKSVPASLVYRQHPAAGAAAAKNGPSPPHPSPPVTVPAPSPPVTVPARPSPSNAVPRSSPSPGLNPSPRPLGLPEAGLNPRQTPLQGTRKALLIGINYTGQKGQLRGCQNDVQLIVSLLRNAGWRPEELLVLLDDPSLGQQQQPTHDGIMQGIRWLSRGVRPGDVRLLHYSGHGGHLPVEPGSKKPPGSLDQTIFPVDHDNGKRQIRDHVLYEEVVAPLPAGSRLTVVMDCCHSGTVLDLPYQFVAHQFSMTKYFRNGHRIPGTNPFFSELDSSHPVRSGLRLVPRLIAGKLESKLDGPEGGGPEGYRRVGDRIPAADVLMFSGCKDWQTSADVQNAATFELPSGVEKGSGTSGGALTFALAKVVSEMLAAGQRISILELLEQMRKLIKEKGLMQVPQLSSSALLDLDAPFTINTALVRAPKPASHR